jgi:D-psicose/D-tagatose/L-ribulose 3-epimerase
MNKIGIHYAVWGNEWDVDMCERVRWAAECGFDVLEVTPPSYMTELNEHKMKDLKQCADDNGLEMSYCIGFPQDYDMASEDETIRRHGIEYTCKMLKAIHMMDGKILSGILYSFWPYNFPTPMPDKQRTWDIALKSVKECVKYAEDYGIIYAIELVNRFEQFLLNSADEGIRFVDEVDSPYCKLLLDMFHMGIEETSTPDAIKKVGGRLAHIHVCQNNREIPKPCDNVPWEKIGQALKDIDYKGRVVMEPFLLKGGSVGKDINMWRNLVSDISKEYISAQLKDGIAFVKEILQ